MTNQMVIAYGLDYLRYKVFSEHDITHVASRLHYVDINTPWFHGSRYVDLTGEQLSLIRTVEDVGVVALELSCLFPCARLDVFVDVEGNVLDAVTAQGTRIYNGGRLETVYSAHLKKRGDAPVFARAYDAMAAGHYDVPVTRFEIEYKRHYAAQLLVLGRWAKHPVAVALNHIKLLLGYSIWLPEISPVEFKATTKPLEHSRERFYTRYGRAIANDIERMGVQGLQRFIMECLSCGEETTDEATSD